MQQLESGQQACEKEREELQRTHLALADEAASGKAKQAEQEEQLEKMTADMTSLGAALAKLEQANAAVTREHSPCSDRAAAARARICVLEEEVALLNCRLNARGAEAEAARAALEEARAGLDQRQDELLQLNAKVRACVTGNYIHI